MVSKKSAARARPMVLASAPAAASATRHGQRSAILRSAFSPARLGLSLFASVIHGFDGQLLRVHDTVSGRLRWEHAAGTSTVACLSWGAGGSSPRAVGQQPSKKRRKVLDDANGAGSDAAAGAVVAYGTHRSEIHLIALDGTPAQVLRDGHTLGIRDFRFVGHGLSEAWSVGGDGRLVQWDVRMGQKLRYGSRLRRSTVMLTNRGQNDSGGAVDEPVVAHAFGRSLRIFDQGTSGGPQNAKDHPHVRRS
jgi:U3 small nucleolar RNA-associated protein 5